MNSRKFRKLILASAIIGVFFAGLAAGYASATASWSVIINGKPEKLPVRIIKNMYFVSLADLARIPGWKVTVDLGGRKISLSTPAGSVAAKPAAANSDVPDANAHVVAQVESSNAEDMMAAQTGVHINNAPGSPPNDVRMTVQAALSSLQAMKSLLDNGSPTDAVKQKKDETSGIVQQAQNLLWQLPRTNTLRTDLQVALEDLESQISMLTAADQVQNGILPWTHPVAQQLLLKYPDLHPCHTLRPKEGLDVECAKKMLSDLSGEDFDDIRRDLDQYR